MKRRPRKSFYIRERLGDDTWGIVLKADVTESIAQGLAERDGRNPDDIAVQEAYIEAIRDTVFGLIDDLMFELRQAANGGEARDEAARVRVGATHYLAERRQEAHEAERVAA